MPPKCDPELSTWCLQRLWDSRSQWSSAVKWSLQIAHKSPSIKRSMLTLSAFLVLTESFEANASFSFSTMGSVILVPKLDAEICLRWYCVLGNGGQFALQRFSENRKHLAFVPGVLIKKQGEILKKYIRKICDAIQAQQRPLDWLL